MSEATEAFVDRVVAAHPDLKPLRRDHLDENFGELLPHVWTSDLARYVTQRFRDEGATAVRPVLDTLEAQLGRDPDVDELVAVSFVELLPLTGEEGAGVTELLGPGLGAMLRQSRG